MATIMWDLDGVATSFDEVFYPRLCALEGWEPMTREERIDWHFHRAHGMSDVAMVARLNEYADAGGFGDQIPVLGFREAVIQIKNAGHTQHVVTSRPEIAAADTAWWVDTYASEIDSVTLADDKTVFMQFGPPLYFAVDDKIQHIEALLHEGVYAFLFRAPYNAHRPDLPAVSTVQEFADIVTGRSDMLARLLRSEAWRNVSAA